MTALSARWERLLSTFPTGYLGWQVPHRAPCWASLRPAGCWGSTAGSRRPNAPGNCLRRMQAVQENDHCHARE